MLAALEELSKCYEEKHSETVTLVRDMSHLSDTREHLQASAIILYQMFQGLTECT